MQNTAQISQSLFNVLFKPLFSICQASKAYRNPYNRPGIVSSRASAHLHILQVLLNFQLYTISFFDITTELGSCCHWITNKNTDCCIIRCDIVSYVTWFLNCNFCNETKSGGADFTKWRGIERAPLTKKTGKRETTEPKQHAWTRTRSVHKQERWVQTIASRGNEYSMGENTILVIMLTTCYIWLTSRIRSYTLYSPWCWRYIVRIASLVQLNSYYIS